MSNFYFSTVDIAYDERGKTLTLDSCSENTVTNIACSFGRVKIVSAFYGRLSSTTCPDLPVLTTACNLDVTDRVKAV